MAGEALYREIIERYIESYNRFDVDGMLADADPAIVFKNISNGRVGLRTDGIGELRKQAEESTRYFAERKQVITGIRFAGAEVEVDIYFIGTAAMDLPGEFSAGEKLELKGKSIFRFQGDKIVELTDIS